MNKTLMAGLSAFGLITSTITFAEQATPAAPAQSATQPTSTPDAAKPTTPEATNDDADRVTCRPMTHNGMVINRNECHTQKQWDKLRRDAQRAVFQYQQQGMYQSTMH